MYVGKKLRQLRLRLDLNQEEMAKELGVSRSYYAAIEISKRKITKKMVDLIKNKWSIAEGYFVENNETKKTKKLGGNTEGVFGGIQNPQDLNSSLDAIEKAFLWTDEQYENHKKNTQDRLRKLMESAGVLELEFHKRLLTDIIQNHSKINGLQSELNDLRIFKYIIENLNHYYFNKVDLQLNSVSKFLINGKFNYEDYKAAYLAEFAKLEQIQPALHKISAAIKQFYKDIEAFDTENIVKGYFGEDMGKKSTK